MKNLLVVFSGKAQSGKTTASKALRDIVLENQRLRLIADPNIKHVELLKDGSFSFIENVNGHPNGTFVFGEAKIVSFATALKKIAEEYFGWDGDKGIYYRKLQVASMEWDPTNEPEELEPIPDKGRQLLINIGQGMRKIRPTIWVDYVINKIKKEGSVGENKVFIIDDMRFKNELTLAKTFDTCVSVRLTRTSQLDINDTSENDLDNATFDYYIDNNGDSEDLKSKMSGLFEQIKLKYQ